MKPKLVFILSDMLGWRTYGDRLTAAIANRDEAEIVVKRVRLPRWAGAISRRNNIRPWQRALPQPDPFDMGALHLRSWWRSLLEEGRPAAVHIAAHTLSACVAARGSVPFSVALDHTRAGIEADLGRGAWGPRFVEAERKLLSQATKLYPMSRWAARSLTGDYDLPQERIEITPPSVKTEAFAPQHARGGPKARMIFIGNDFARKGGDRLASWVKGPLSDAVELHIASGDPAAQAVSGEGIVHYGRVANDRLLQEILPRMDLLCLPTHSDMSPQVLAEAAAAGLPSVASDIAGIGDLVLDGRTGLLCAPGDEDAFLRAIRTLAADRTKCTHMGNAAREHAAATLSAERNFNALFDAMLSGYRAGAARASRDNEKPKALPC